MFLLLPSYCCFSDADSDPTTVEEIESTEHDRAVHADSCDYLTHLVDLADSEICKSMETLDPVEAMNIIQEGLFTLKVAVFTAVVNCAWMACPSPMVSRLYKIFDNKYGDLHWSC